MNEAATRPRRAVLRHWLAQAGDAPDLRRALDALAPDGAHGAVLVERLRFGPPETWRGWRAGFGPVAVKLWPAEQAPPPLRPVTHPGVAPLLGQGEGWRVFAWIEGRSLRTGDLTAAVVDQVAEALAALHAAGQAHGDLTPANVVLGTPANVVLGTPANVVLGAAGAVLIDWGEDSAGTPGWRPDHPHDALDRDRFALARLRRLTLSASP